MFSIKCTTKRALAILLSVVIILSMIPLGLAFAQTADYTITSAAPAIPMNSLTSVSFSAFNVETADGTVLGTALTFENVSESG